MSSRCLPACYSNMHQICPHRQFRNSIAVCSSPYEVRLAKFYSLATSSPLTKFSPSTSMLKHINNALLSVAANSPANVAESLRQAQACYAKAMQTKTRKAALNYRCLAGKSLVNLQVSSMIKRRHHTDFHPDCLHRGDQPICWLFTAKYRS